MPTRSGKIGRASAHASCCIHLLKEALALRQFTGKARQVSLMIRKCSFTAPLVRRNCAQSN
ncbi:MAG: hypothetical protein WB660_23255, partial [Candidatus Sulfotelmatobacter sp.]